MTDLENRMAKGPWIRIAPSEEANSHLKRAYERIGANWGRIPEIRSVMAGEPGVVEGMAGFYPENNAARVCVETEQDAWRHHGGGHRRLARGRLDRSADRCDGARDGHLRVHESGGGGVRAYAGSAAKVRESGRVGERKRIVTRLTIQRAGR
jgi:hypothetical protein